MAKEKQQNPQFGILVRIPAEDPFVNLVGENWQTTHWYTTQTERDLALVDMAREHEYSRSGDKPTLTFAPVNRPSDG